MKGEKNVVPQNILVFFMHSPFDIHLNLDASNIGPKICVLCFIHLPNVKHNYL